VANRSATGGDAARDGEPFRLAISKSISGRFRGGKEVKAHIGRRDCLRTELQPDDTSEEVNASERRLGGERTLCRSTRKSELFSVGSWAQGGEKETGHDEARAQLQGSKVCADEVADYRGV